MIKVEHSIVVPRSVDEVFSFLSNFEHDPHWQTGILEAKQTPEGVTLVGTTIRQVRKFLGRRLDYTGEVIDYEENKKIWVKSISGPYPFEGGYALEPVDGGTKVTFLLSVQPRGIIRFTQSMVARELKKQMEMDSSRLRDLLKA
ncbi:MAG: SRPBCC family protein [Deltaproteobacteria bacterium]|nr:SRPBCC family protein [Deltaproteobacteria bacterium]MBI2365553.1 SRPBCC family protein [Deltaproteobacteria bacterium]MBI3064397.1 SRPBCC family protein [Deltaproteobacteria bacterium]